MTAARLYESRESVGENLVLVADLAASAMLSGRISIILS